VRLNWKIFGLVLFPALLLLGAGCGGVNAGGSASPASFLLPGLMQADPVPAPPAEPASATEFEVAQF